MYIHSKPAAAFYKLGIGTVSLGLEWYLLCQFGWNAFRLFPVWALLLAALYYLSSALYLAVSDRKATGRNLCPMLEGMIIIGLLSACLMMLASYNYRTYLTEPLSSIVMWICAALGVASVLDWRLFVKKGRWKIMMPFYWLALPFSYLGMMAFTAELLPEHAVMRYPLEMLNYLEFGFWEMLQYMLALFVIAIVAGYILYIFDFAMSGKLAKSIVLPHIRVEEITENPKK